MFDNKANSPDGYQFTHNAIGTVGSRVNIMYVMKTIRDGARQAGDPWTAAVLSLLAPKTCELSSSHQVISSTACTVHGMVASTTCPRHVCGTLNLPTHTHINHLYCTCRCNDTPLMSVRSATNHPYCNYDITHKVTLFP